MGPEPGIMQSTTEASEQQARCCIVAVSPALAVALEACRKAELDPTDRHSSSRLPPLAVGTASARAAGATAAAASSTIQAHSMALGAAIMLGQWMEGRPGLGGLQVCTRLYSTTAFH